MSNEWCEDNFLDFKELEEQITKFVDKSDYDEMLRIQLNELEMLESMFSNPGEFSVYDYSVIADINDFLDNKITLLPPCLDFTINLICDKIKLEVCVNLPHDYPASEPDIFVRNDELTRNEQHDLNSDLAAYISTLDRGEICICFAISWLQENGIKYLNKTRSDNFVESNSIHSNRNDLFQTPNLNDSSDSEQVFMRYWIYSHHIYSKIKRREILDLAHEYNITGFCLPGRPGIICGEGWNTDCEEWWQKIRSMNWKKIMCKKKEEVPLINTSNHNHTSSSGSNINVDDFRKFKGFHEICFEGGRTKSRDAHMDMGEFFRYLSDHECSYVFKDYFGVDGKPSGANASH